MILLLLAQSAAQASTVPLDPHGEWIRRFEPNRCQLVREFGKDDRGMMLIITPLIDSERLSFTLLRHGKLRHFNTSTATLTLLPSGSSATVSPISAASSDGAYDRSDLFFDRTHAWGEVSNSRALRIDERAGSITLNLDGIAPALASLIDCQDQMLKAIGVDPVAARSIVKGPDPANNPAFWITNDDYPTAALRARYDGTVEASWTVDTTGKVIGCRITDGPHLDVFGPLLCTLAPSRARFRPARDANGKPVTSLFRYRFTFNLPR